MSTLHYLDLHLRIDPETPPEQLMATLYQRLHALLVRLRCDDVGVSFPGYEVQPKLTLGSTLRLIAPEARLTGILTEPWLGGMRDLVHADKVSPVPEGASAAWLNRVQPKTGIDRLRRRAIKRHGLTDAEARTRLPDTAAEHRPSLPSLRLRSGSSGQSYELFLRLHKPAVPSAGSFNSFGLSTTATLPWF